MMEVGSMLRPGDRNILPWNADDEQVRTALLSREEHQWDKVEKAAQNSCRVWRE